MARNFFPKNWKNLDFIRILINKRVRHIVRKIDEFRESMKPSEELYTKELENYAKKFPSLGKMSLRERPDIDTLDYIYSFQKLNGASKEELDLIHQDLYSHMKKFSKENNIQDFYMNAVIHL